MEITKILMLILVCAVICIVFKIQKPEFSFVITIVCALIVLSFVIDKLITPISLIEQKISQSGINSSYFKTALKALGIGYVSSFVADACKDAGLSSLATKAELAGKCAIFVLCIPLALSILEIAVGFVQ